MGNFNRDYQFYLSHLDDFDFAGRPPVVVPLDPTGPDARSCFRTFDSTGKLRPSSEPELVSRLITCKSGVNLHVKMWAEALAMGTYTLFEIQEFLAEWNAPAWVLKAVQRQALKHGWLSDAYAAEQVAVYGR